MTLRWKLNPARAPTRYAAVNAPHIKPESDNELTAFADKRPNSGNRDIGKQALGFWRWQEQMIAFAITLATFTVLGPFQSYAMPTLLLRHPVLDEWLGGFCVALAVSLVAIPTT